MGGTIRRQTDEQSSISRGGGQSDRTDYPNPSEENAYACGRSGVERRSSVRGDGDFVRLIKHLKGKHKNVVVVAGKDRLSKGAERAASDVIHLKDIKRR